MSEINRNEGRGVEVSIYQNGQLVAEIRTHYIQSLRERSEFSLHVPSMISPARSFCVRGVFGAELVDDFLTIRELWLLDGSNAPIGSPRPALWYLGVSDIPLTTVFQSHRDRPLSHAGIWVVALRSPDTMSMLRAKLPGAAE